MEIKNFHPKWAISERRGRPMYASSGKLLVAYDYFMKAIPVKGGPATYYMNPKMRIGSACTHPELGQVAKTNRFVPTFLAVNNYPEMKTLQRGHGHSRHGTLSSLVKADGIEDCVGISILGAKFLVLASFKSGLFRFELWNWKAGNLVHSVCTPQFGSEVGMSQDLQVHPRRWYQAALQTSSRVIVLEVKASQDHFYLELNYFFIEVSATGPVLRKACCHDRLRETSLEETPPTLTLLHFCWLAEDKVIIATSNGVFKAGLGGLTLLKLVDLEAKAASIVQNGQCLYVAYEVGLVDVVCIKGGEWEVKRTIDVDQPLTHAFLSPDSKHLTLTTQDHSIINLDIDCCDGSEQLSAFSDPKLKFKFLKEIVDVGFLGPVLSHCVVVEKFGDLHVIDEADGSIVSTIRTDDIITSMASSPLCSLVVLGSHMGVLYFVDCTVLTKPRVVRCETPFYLPILRLKFDNFGRFVAASSENRTVKIFSAVPTAGLEPLGSITMDSDVRDVAAFCRSDSEGTFLFVLTEDESRKIGVLSRFLLPKDIASCCAKYQEGIFGALRLDALDPKHLQLGRPFQKVEIHRDLGALLSQLGPGRLTVFAVDPWTDSESAWPRLLMSKEGHSCSWCLSPDQDWMATVRRKYSSRARAECEHIQLRSCSVDLTGIARGGPKVRIFSSDRAEESRVQFSPFSCSLICGKRNGGVVSCRWGYNYLRRCSSLPEWMVHCFSRFEAENAHLKAMQGEVQQPECVSYVAETLADPAKFEGKELNFLEACVSVINFKLGSIRRREFIDKPRISGYTNEADCICELSSNNRKLLLFLAERMHDEVKHPLQNLIRDQGESPVPPNTQETHEAYSRDSIKRDRQLLKILDKMRSIGDRIQTHYFTPGHIVIANCIAKSLSSIEIHLRSICDHKIAFNKKFVASVSMAKSDEKSGSVLNDDAEDDPGSPRGFDTVDASRTIVDDLRTMKRLCDFSILGSELKMYVTLLFCKVAYDWKAFLDVRTDSLAASMSKLAHAEEEIGRLGKGMKRALRQLQKSERRLSRWLEDMCLQLNFPETVLDQIKDQVERGLDWFVQDHKSSLSIESEWDPTNLRDFARTCPVAVPRSVSERVQEKQACLLTSRILMWNLKRQMLFVSDTKELCYDTRQQLKKTQDELDHALKLLSMLVSRFSARLQSVLAILDEMSSLVKEERIMSEVEAGELLDNLSANESHDLWKDVGLKTLRMVSMKQRLNEIEDLYGRVKGMNSTVLKRSRWAFDMTKVTEDIQRRFEEAGKAFAVAKSFRKEYVNECPKRAKKILKTVFSI